MGYTAIQKGVQCEHYFVDLPLLNIASIYIDLLSFDLIVLYQMRTFLGAREGPRPPSRSRPHGADCIDAFDADASSQIGKNIQCHQLKSSKIIKF